MTQHVELSSSRDVGAAMEVEENLSFLLCLSFLRVRPVLLRTLVGDARDLGGVWIMKRKVAVSHGWFSREQDVARV